MRKLDETCPACGHKSLYRRADNLLPNIRARTIDNENRRFVCLNCHRTFDDDEIEIDTTAEAKSVFETLEHSDIAWVVDQKVTHVHKTPDVLELELENGSTIKCHGETEIETPD